MSYPAWKAFARDPDRTYARWCVYMALQTLISHSTPQPLKLDVIHRAARVSRGQASKALGWLILRGYVKLHGRDARGMPTLSLVWELPDVASVPDGNKRAG